MQFKKLEFLSHTISSSVALPLSRPESALRRKAFRARVAQLVAVAKSVLTKIVTPTAMLFTESISAVRRTNILHRFVNWLKSRRQSNRFSHQRRPPGKAILTLIAVAIIGALAYQGLRKLGQMNAQGESQRIKVQGAKAAFDINQEFQFPLKDDKGKEVSRIKFLIEKAELRDEIIVKGQRATAVEGRTFLIITLKIANEFDRPIEVDTRDYIRLSVNGNEQEWLAPDIHNDPVEVQAISTKYTRVGFPVNDTDSNLVFQIGEIQGEKQRIPITFTR